MRLTARGGHLLPSAVAPGPDDATASPGPTPLPTDPVFLAAGALLGLVAGGLAGLLGIGGGVLLVPGLGWLFEQRLGLPHDTAVKAAVATSLAVIGCTSLSSMRAHHRRGAVHWPAVVRLVPGIAVGALLAAALASRLPADLLVVAFAAFVLFSASRLWRGGGAASPPADAAPVPDGGWPERLAAGGVIGSAAALVGAGGAFVLAAYLRWRGLPIHRAIGTSAAIGLPVAVSGAGAYVLAGLTTRSPPAAALGFVGFVHGPALLVVALASVTMAPWGARLAHATDRRRLERGFAGLLVTLAGWMLLRTLMH